MASTATANMRRPDQTDDWVDEMKVRFDADELASFYDRFEPLEFTDDCLPVLPDETDKTA